MADTSFGLSMAADFDLLGGTVDGMDIDKMSKEDFSEFMDAATMALNGAVNMILGELSLPTTDSAALLDQGAQIGEWEQATELTRGRRRKTGGTDGVGFPVYKYLMRSGWTRDYLAKVSNIELFRHFRKVSDGYLTGNWKNAIRAIFQNTEVEWSDEMFAEDGTLKIKTLLNNDGYISPTWGQNEFDGTEVNHIALGTGTLDEADLSTLADRLRAHGLGVSEASGGMGGRIEVWINSDERADVEGHTNFIAPNDSVIVNINKIYAAGIETDNYVGYNTAARVHIREVDYIPADYQLAFVTNSQPDSSQFAARANGFAPLRRRVPAQANLRGIRRIQESRYPLQDTFWEDWYGFGVRVRQTAVCGKIAASYSVPTIS